MLRAREGYVPVGILKVGKQGIYMEVDKRALLFSGGL
jgi:hypothetical protein